MYRTHKGNSSNNRFEQKSEGIDSKWGICCNFLEYEQLRFIFQNHIDVKYSILTCLRFLIPISKPSFEGRVLLNKSRKKANRSIPLSIMTIWEESPNDTVNFDQMRTCFIFCNRKTECTPLRYMQFKIVHNRLVTQQ